MKKKKTKNWFLFTHYYCPVCGRENIYKELIKDRVKPIEYIKRHIFKEVYDFCMEG